MSVEKQREYYDERDEQDLHGNKSDVAEEENENVMLVLEHRVMDKIDQCREGNQDEGQNTNNHGNEFRDANDPSFTKEPYHPWCHPQVYPSLFR